MDSGPTVNWPKYCGDCHLSTVFVGIYHVHGGYMHTVKIPRKPGTIITLKQTLCACVVCVVWTSMNVYGGFVQRSPVRWEIIFQALE